MLGPAERRTDLGQVLLDDLDRPIEHGQHRAPLWTAAALGLAPAHVDLPVGTELRQPVRRTEVADVEHRDLRAAQPPGELVLNSA